MNQINKISIIIPCRNEEKYIEDCLESILNNDYPKDSLEVFVIDGESTDSTIERVGKYITEFNFIKLLKNKKHTVPFALNIGIKEAAGDFIIRLDAHSKIPNNYFSTLIKWSKARNADNIGAVCITDVKNKNPKTNSIIKVLSNRFGVGNSYFRIGTDRIKEVDHVPFGCFKKEIFDKVGLFDERLVRNQDIEFSKRILKMGGRIFLLPDLFCTYFARETFGGIAKNNFGNGFWNILTVYITRNIGSLSLRHFIPFLFVLSLLVPCIFVIWEPIVGLITVGSLFSYLVLVVVISYRINDSTTSFWSIFCAFITLHLSYGFGSLIGFLRIDYLLKAKND